MVLYETGHTFAAEYGARAAFEKALTVFAKHDHPSEWAVIQNNLCVVSKSIAAGEGTLTVYTKQDYPAQWAWTQANLAYAWDSSRDSSHSEEELVHFDKAISAYTNALTVFTEKDYPLDWAFAKRFLGRALTVSSRRQAHQCR